MLREDQVDRVCTVLDKLGYLEDGAVTPAGDQLARVYSESDLLVAHQGGTWHGTFTAEGPAKRATCDLALQSIALGLEARQARDR